jgi:hypothetical protein
MQAQLENLIGNAGTLLPDGPSDTGQPYYVWSCWETAPPDLDGIVENDAQDSPDSPEELRAKLLCGPGNPRRKTGTPCPVELFRDECRTWAVARGLVEQD